MPKAEAALTDPMALSGLVGPTLSDEDVAEMTDALVDEFARLGFDDEELMSLFRNPHYALTHWVWRTRGEAYAREAVARVRERWGGVWRFRTELGVAAFERDDVDDLLDADEESDFVPIASVSSLRS